MKVSTKLEILSIAYRVKEGIVSSWSRKLLFRGLRWAKQMRIVYDSNCR